jgi:hypothetical protein
LSLKPSLSATLVVCLFLTTPAWGQTPVPPGLAGPPPRELKTERPDATASGMPTLADPFRHYVGDLRRFISVDTFAVVGIGGGLALAAHPWDGHTKQEAREHLLAQQGKFTGGNIGGMFLVQAAAGYTALAVGRSTGNRKVAWLGADLVRAQFLSQTVVQGLKYTTSRTRPDGSNDKSFPSGHTASATATASVLQRYFGWKAGVPAYAFAAYVGASRIASDKHHLSDVLMGATLGIAAGRTVTVGLAGEKFDVGITPTVGGAAVMFTKR